MIRANYEEYLSDRNRSFKKAEFQDLEELADWIFEHVGNGYSDKSKGRYLLWFPTPQKMEKIKSDGPARIEFRPLNSSSYIWIHMITNGKRIIFSDGKLTEGRTYWNQAVRKWLEQCEYRQYHPEFVFDDDEPEEAEPVLCKREISVIAYGKYQLDWMMRHGYILQDVICGLEACRKEMDERGSYNLPSLFIDWKEDMGFYGDLWVSRDEFMDGEYRDKGYMRSILTDDEFRKYLDDIGEGSVTFLEALELVEEAVEKGVLSSASIQPKGGEKSTLVAIVRETGTYYEPVDQIARELMFDKEGRDMIRKELRKKSVGPAKQPDTGTEPPKGPGANRIQVPLAGGEMLSIYQNADPGFPHEVFVEVIGADGKWQQDIACIRNEIDRGKDGSLHVLKDRYEVLVWGDGESEDYTEKFLIKKPDGADNH